MKSGATPSKLAKATEASLVSLGFRYLKNEGRGLLEFEVTEPEAFLVRIRSLEETEQPSPIFGLMLTRRQSACTDLSLVMDPENPAARIRASEFIRGVLGSLKVPPWKGLGFMESRSSRSIWQRWAEGLERPI